LKGKLAIVQDTCGIVPDFVKALNELGYRSENGLSVRMAMAWLIFN
jgi:hypothetical protein